MFSEAPDKFLMNSSIGIHSVAADGTIIYANQCELEILGYTEEEFVGHNTAEFQLDQFSLNDMFMRLNRGEGLKNYPARVQGKHGVKYFLYNSNTHQEDGEIIHTRCYAVDIEEDVYRVFKAASPYFKEQKTA